MREGSGSSGPRKAIDRGQDTQGNDLACRMIAPGNARSTPLLPNLFVMSLGPETEMSIVQISFLS